MNKAYIAILSALGASVVKSAMSGSASKRKHPSQIFGGYEGLFEKRKHYDKDASAEEKKAYSVQPKYYDEIIREISDTQLIENLKQLFTRDRKAKNTFENIVSDFYLRPKYWLDLLHTALYKQSLFDQVPLSQSSLSFDTEKLSPTLVSQFFPQESESKNTAYTIMSYSVDAFRRRRNKKADLFELFEGNQMFDLAQKFYAEYIVGETTELDGFRFWLMILHSVIADLAQKTTYESVQKSLQDRESWYKKNIKRVKETVNKFLKSSQKMLEVIDIEIEDHGRPIVIQQKVYLDKDELGKTKPNQIAEKILSDALDNWIFAIRTRYEDKTSALIPVVSIQYTPRMFAIREGKRIITRKSGGVFEYQSKEAEASAKTWIQNFVRSENFTTLLSKVNRKTGEIEYTPVEICLSPLGPITIKRTGRAEAEEWIRKTHNMLPKFPESGLLDIIGAYDYGDRLMAVMVLNTPPHVASTLEDAPGQYHIIDISRIAVNNNDAGRRLAVILTKWAIKNKEFYNRSAWKGNANVVTYSMLHESGRTYESAGMKPTRLSAAGGSKHERTDSIIKNTWKIRWESNPWMNISEKVKLPKIKPWLPKLHRAYVKISQCHIWDYGNNCWKKLPKKEVKLSEADIKGVIVGSPKTSRQDYVAISQLVKVCGYSWRDALSQIKVEYQGTSRGLGWLNRNNVSMKIAVHPVINWINSQKHSCPNNNDLLLAKIKLCKR